MISCVITTLKVNEYQRKSDFLRINFIISRTANIKKSNHMSVSLGLTECISLDDMVFLSIHVMKATGISPFNHLKCINWCLILIAVRISSATLLYKLQNATEKVVFRTNASSQNS